MEFFQNRAWVKKLDWKAGQLVIDGAVHDGDTAWLFLDHGERDYMCASCRLWGINAYELTDKDPVRRQKAVEGREWLKSQIQGKEVYVISKDLDKYGRPLVIIWLDTMTFGSWEGSVNNAMVKLELAVPYTP